MTERTILCTALFQLHFDTAIKNKLQTAQNKTITYLLNYDCMRHIGFSDFKKANYLDIKGRFDYRALSVMYSVF